MQQIVLKPAIAPLTVECGVCHGYGWIHGRKKATSRVVDLDCLKCRNRRKAAKRAAVV